MLICLEGNEGGGKSTLSEILTESWRYSRPGRKADLIHVGPPDLPTDGQSLDAWRDEATQRLLDQFADYDIEDPEYLLVFDRFHWGSVVYGSLFRPGLNTDGLGDLGFDRFCKVEHELALRGAVTALVLPPVETIVSRSVGRVDEYLDTVDGASDRTSQLLDIQSRYISLARELRLILPTALGYPIYADRDKTPGEIAAAPKHYTIPGELEPRDLEVVQDVLLGSHKMTRHNTWPMQAFEQSAKMVAGNLVVRARSVQYTALSKMKRAEA